MKTISLIIMFICIGIMTVLISSTAVPEKNNHKDRGDYQFYVHFDSMWIYDNGRFVGSTILVKYSPLDSIICKDNE